MEGGVLPRIKELLHRIGERKARYFAVMDLTSGYHQTAIDEDSMKYTAFVTSAGVFEWRRVPMGLKGAPTYFQREMAQTVLAGIIGYGAELYIDDCIVYGKTEEEFLANLESVFEKFKAHNITLNPKKCRFGQSAIEYLGQIIDKDGLRFSREKLDGVLNFNTPVVIKDLQKFIGLVNWFRDHIPNLSEEMKLLREMEEEAKKSRKLRWTDERRAQFEKLKQMFNDLQSLYFLVEGGTVKVYTDASDYAIGGYVCQVINGIEQPVGFMSKTLTHDQRKWTTTERECYAIYMTLQKYEYLLRDIEFQLYTDHENLVYLNNPPSNKVLRWKLAIQEYNFTISHIAGEYNVVADGFSRLTEEIPQTYASWPSEGTSNLDNSETRASRGHVGNHGTNPQLLAEPTPVLEETPSKRRKLEVKMAMRTTRNSRRCDPTSQSSSASDRGSTEGNRPQTRASTRSKLIEVTVPTGYQPPSNTHYGMMLDSQWTIHSLPQ